MSEVSPRKCPWLKILLGGVARGVLGLAGLAWGMRGTDCFFRLVWVHEKHGK